MKVLLSKTVCDFFETMEAMQAAHAAIAVLYNKVGGLGGIIGISREGEYAFAHNTPKMAFAYLSADGTVLADIGCCSS